MFQLAVLNQLQKQLPDMDLDMGMATCGWNEEFYLELLNDFTLLNIKNELTNYYQMGNYNEYCVRVHGFKSSAYSVGAKTVGDFAFEIEKKINGSFPVDIVTLQERLFEQFDKVRKGYTDVMTQRI